LVKTIISILVFFPIWLSAQDITGVWTGYLKTPGSKLDYELTISEGIKNLVVIHLLYIQKMALKILVLKKQK
jgi:hypothetical protein